MRVPRVFCSVCWGWRLGGYLVSCFTSAFGVGRIIVFAVRSEAGQIRMPASQSAGRLAARNGPDDEQGLRPRRDRVGQRGVRRRVGHALLGGEELQHRPALVCDVVANCPAQHRIAGLQSNEKGGSVFPSAHFALVSCVARLTRRPAPRAGLQGPRYKRAEASSGQERGKPAPFGPSGPRNSAIFARW